MCAASPIAGAVLRCAGSARIWRLGTSGSCLHDFGAKLGAGENPDAFRRKYRAQAVDCLLNQRALAEEFQDLFGAAAPAARPKPRASAAGQNQTILMRHDDATDAALLDRNIRAPASVCGSIASW